MFLNAGLIYDIHLESSSAGLWEYPTRCSKSPAFELSKCRTLGISYMMFPKSGTRGSGATVPQCHSAAVPQCRVPECRRCRVPDFGNTLSYVILYASNFWLKCKEILGSKRMTKSPGSPDHLSSLGIWYSVSFSQNFWKRITCVKHENVFFLRTTLFIKATWGRPELQKLFKFSTNLRFEIAK